MRFMIQIVNEIIKMMNKNKQEILLQKLKFYLIKNLLIKDSKKNEFHTKN